MFFNKKIYSKTFLLRELWALISLDVFDVYQYFLSHVIENVNFSYPKIFFRLKIFISREIKDQSEKIAKNVPNGTFFGVRVAKGLTYLSSFMPQLTNPQASIYIPMNTVLE